MSKGGFETKGSDMTSWLSNPFCGSSNTIQPKVTDSDGRKNVTQKANSSMPRTGRSVRAKSHASSTALGSEIDSLAARTLMVFATALSIDGSEKAARQP